MYNDQNDFPKTLYFARSISDHFDAVVRIDDTEDSDIEIVKVIEGTKDIFDGKQHVKQEPKDINEGTVFACYLNVNYTLVFDNHKLR